MADVTCLLIHMKGRVFRLSLFLSSILSLLFKSNKKKLRSSTCFTEDRNSFIQASYAWGAWLPLCHHWSPLIQVRSLSALYRWIDSVHLECLFLSSDRSEFAKRFDNQSHLCSIFLDLALRLRCQDRSEQHPHSQMRTRFAQRNLIAIAILRPLKMLIWGARQVCCYRDGPKEESLSLIGVEHS